MIPYTWKFIHDKPFPPTGVIVEGGYRKILILPEKGLLKLFDLNSYHI